MNKDTMLELAALRLPLRSRTVRRRLIYPIIARVAIIIGYIVLVKRLLK